MKVLLILLILSSPNCVIEINQNYYAELEVHNGPTEAEWDLVERVVASEARGECYEGKKAVAQVIYNRCALWNKSIEEVCYAEGQFARPYNGEISESIKQAVRDAYYDCDSLGNATHFSSNGVNWGKEEVAKIGCHTFYR